MMRAELSKKPKASKNFNLLRKRQQRCRKRQYHAPERGKFDSKASKQRGRHDGPDGIW